MFILPQLFPTNPTYTANAVNFDGTSTFIDRDGTLTGLSNGKAATYSFWIKRGALGADGLWEVASGVSNCDLEIVSGNILQLVLFDSGGTNRVLLFNGGNLSSTSIWYHILISFDLSSPTSRQVYINDVLQADGGFTDYDDVSVGWTDGDFRWGISSGNYFNGDMADLWWDDSYIDFSVQANRRKFIDSEGKPVSLGATGSRPTGTPPIIFQSGITDSWHTNKGTGGGFTENGTLTTASTSPSD